MAGGSEGRDHSHPEKRSAREREAAMGIATIWNVRVISFTMRSHTANFPAGWVAHCHPPPLIGEIHGSWRRILLNSQALEEISRSS